MMKSKWIEHKGKKIMFADYRDFKLDAAGFAGEVDQVKEIMLKEPPASILIIVDVTDTIGSMENFNCLKHSAKETKNVVAKTAVLGVTGTRLNLMNIIMKFAGIKIVAFDHIEAAKEWLVE